MKSPHAQKLFDQIDVTISNLNGFITATPLEQSYLAKFLVVFICGIYEEIVEEIINEMVAKVTNNNPEVCKFIQDHLRYRFRNPDMNNIVKLLKQFNDSWETTLLALPRIARDALNSIVENKNAIAHGQQTVLTIADVKRYYIDSRVVIEKIDDMLI